MGFKKKMLHVLLALVVVLGILPNAVFASEGSAQFSDMPNNWSTAALQDAVANGLLTGADGKIKPNANLTRAEMAAIIVRAFGATVKKDLSSFTDIKSSAWYVDDLAKAYQMGVINGSGGKMNPSSTITRQEVFVILARAFKLQSASAAKVSFSDVNDISEWAKGDVFAFVNAGYVQGANGKLNPKAPITRAEFAQTLNNILKQYVRTAGVVTEVVEGNVMINKPGVTLDNVQVKGDLIIGDGVGDGEVTLNNVAVSGRLVVRGGGVNSIIIKGNSTVSNVIVARVDGAVSVKVQGDATVEVIYIDDGSDDVNVQGSIGSIEVKATGITVTAVNADIQDINLSGGNSKVVIDSNSKVNKIDVASGASNAQVDVAGKVASITTAAPSTQISGKGDVAKVDVQAGATNAKVETPKTQITVAAGVTGVTAADGVAVNGGTTVSNNGAGTIVFVPQPSNDGTVANVSTLSDLNTALSNTAIQTINVTANIIDIESTIVVNRAVTINGGSHKLTFSTNFAGAPNGERQGILVQANGVTINNIEVVVQQASGWKGVYGVQVYDVTGVVLNNYIGSGADAALLVNGSSVELTGTTTVSGNEFGGIEVSRGTSASRNSTLTVTGSLVNTDEAYGKPTIWTVNGQGSVTGTNKPTFSNGSIGASQEQFYLVNVHAGITDAATLDELNSALANTTIEAINVTADINNIPSSIVINRSVSINGIGSGKKLTFIADFSNQDNGQRQGILVQANDVNIRGIEVVISSPAGWNGIYGVQVYDAKRVVLNNFKASGADAALLVNGSSVELIGTTTVSGNEFGGIEVSKGSLASQASTLTVTGTLVNTAEAYGKPTIWAVNGQGSVTGVNAPTITNTLIKSDQTQYYVSHLSLESAYVATEAALRAALAETNVYNVYITADINNISSTIVIDRHVTINAGSHKLTFSTDFTGRPAGQRQGILVQADSVSINNLEVVIPSATGWNGVYGVQAYDSEVAFSNYKGSGADAALLVNGSTVTLTGTTTVSGNEFGGIEVAKGTAAVKESVLTLAGPLVNTDEAYGKPTIWVVNGQGQLKYSGSSTFMPSYTNTVINSTQTQYYLNYASVSTVSVTSENALRAALADPQVFTININADINNISSTILVQRPFVEINGKGHTLTFSTDFAGEAPGSRQGIGIFAKEVVVNDLEVVVKNTTGWQGAYGIQVYDVTGVILNNYTGSGADAALLVNGSSVELKGITTVSGNDFGGIEVSQGSLASKPSTLKVTGTLVNTTESSDKPTIWVIDGQGTVTNPPLNTLPSGDGKTYYYIKVESLPV
ncbi:MAG: S-layer homology domain-containing protein [Candidatus Cohnella colombiensis]|uniref:S-layer homology domain-containing protein n=1 Tax=Candidatus Cohnella colombiensis TaxID=3121368 RepID=A0AA95EZ76_9BACL|nr:MAG: S-layer homology domain-containing protein [Cohnella sp.]